MADLSGLDHGLPESPIPKAVLQRRIHIDGDILAYYCAGNDETPLGVARQNLHSRIATLAAWAGAPRFLTHITDPQSDKGQRFEIAKTWEYQGNRSYSKRPKNWQGLRELLEGLAVDDFHYISHRNREADDGMSIAAWDAWYSKPEGAAFSDWHVTCSADKDMRQLPGLHLDMDTMELWIAHNVHVYQDWAEADEETQKWMTRGTLGKGRLFHGVWFLLWQMLAGDGADNIPGVQVVPGHWLKYHDDSLVSAKARAGKEEPKDKKVGYGLAADILGVINPLMPSIGMAVVISAYKAQYGAENWNAYFLEQWELLCLDFDERGRESRLDLAKLIQEGEFDAEVTA